MGRANSLHEQEKGRYVHPKAALSASGRGRILELGSDDIRTEYQRDVHRIIYSQTFRRLRHKTQVFFMPDNDHICTRMEHSLQVASAARTVARALGLNEDLAEAIGLAHDLGHTPFGHHGETVLGEISRKYGIATTFHHEVHGLRVVDKLAELDRECQAGLNLTWEVRDGIISHNGEALEEGVVSPGSKDKNLESITTKRQAGAASTLEGCIVRLVDKIAYAGRDLEDGIRAGIINDGDVPADARKLLGEKNGDITGKLLQALIRTSESKGDQIALSDDMTGALKTLIDFNYDKIYLGKKAQAYKSQARYALERIFELLLNETGRVREMTSSADLPAAPRSSVFGVFTEFVGKIDYDHDECNGRIVLDFLSGFTDNYVLRVAEDLLIPQTTV